MARPLAIVALCLPLSGCAFVLDFDGFEVSGGADGGDLDGGADPDTGLPDGFVPDGCEPADEICDGMDNDCNGVVDDVDPPPSTQEDCGICGLSCRASFECADRLCTDEVADVAGGGEFTCARLRSGQVFCFGANDQGQIGIGTTTATEAEPREVTSLGAASDVGAGAQHACAIVGRMVRCWGANESGQLADETSTRRLMPVNTNGDGALEVVAGASHTCYRTDTETGRCAGDNARAQLGVLPATTPDRPRFAEIPLFEGVKQLAAGDDHNCAVVGSSREVYCWGHNGQGQAGVAGGVDTVPTPTPISLPGPATEVTAGGQHSCALVADAVYCWGENGSGQLGNDSTTDSTPPVMVMNLPGNALAITAGGDHTCGVVEVTDPRTEMQVWCWGDNASGQLGYASFEPRELPVRVGAMGSEITRATTVLGAGGAHTCVGELAATPVLSCWGDNTSGQLGIGSTGTPESTIPVPSRVPPE